MCTRLLALGPGADEAAAVLRLVLKGTPEVSMRYWGMVEQMHANLRPVDARCLARGIAPDIQALCAQAYQASPEDVTTERVQQMLELLMWAGHSAETSLGLLPDALKHEQLLLLIQASLNMDGELGQRVVGGLEAFEPPHDMLAQLADCLCADGAIARVVQAPEQQLRARAVVETLVVQVLRRLGQAQLPPQPLSSIVLPIASTQRRFSPTLYQALHSSARPLYARLLNPPDSSAAVALLPGGLLAHIREGLQKLLDALLTKLENKELNLLQLDSIATAASAAHDLCPPPFAQRLDAAIADCYRLPMLPNELWQHISTFLESELLSQVCRPLRAELQHQHLRLQGCWDRRGENPIFSWQATLRTLRLFPAPLGLLLCLDVLLSAQHLHTLVLDMSCRQLGDSDVEALAALKGAPSLKTLTLDLSRNHVTGYGAQALVALIQSLKLRTLTLNLTTNNVGDSGAQAFAGLFLSSSLECISLDIQNNHLSDEGVQALAAFQVPEHRSACARLHKLCLGLGNSGPLSDGAQKLAALSIAHSLQTLHLDLKYSRLGDRGVASLAALATSTHLHTLHINLRSNGIGVRGLAALATFQQAASLRILKLNLSLNRICKGGEALSSLMLAPKMHTLDLNFSHNQLHWGIESAFDTLHQAASLHTIHLDLSHNALCDQGINTLAPLTKACFLHTLHLNLSDNMITNDGAAKLTMLKESASLCTIHLDLSGNKLTDQGCEYLANFKDFPLLQDLSLKLSGCWLADKAAIPLARIREAPMLHTLRLDLSHNLITDQGAKELEQLREAPLLRDFCLCIASNLLADQLRKRLRPSIFDPRKICRKTPDAVATTHQ